MKHAVALVLLAITGAVLADFSVGINLSTSLERRNQERELLNTTTENISTDFGFRLVPSIIIEPARNVEVVPSVGMAFYKWSSETQINDSSFNESDGSGFGMGGGCGLFFRIIDEKAFRLSIGPDAQFWWSNPDTDNDDDNILDMSAGLPVNIDLILSKRLWTRLSARLGRIGYRWEAVGEDGHNGTFTFFDIQTVFTPSLGFYFSF